MSALGLPFLALLRGSAVQHIVIEDDDEQGDIWVSPKSSIAGRKSSTRAGKITLGLVEINSATHSLRHIDDKCNEQN